MSVVMLSISHSTVDCNQYNLSTTKVFIRYKTEFWFASVLYLTKTFVVKTLY